MEFEIKPRNRIGLGFRELWEYRELFYFFTLRDIRIKYKQTVLGFLWAVLQPLILTLIFTFFLGRAIAVQAPLGMRYDLFALSGLVLWSIFATGLNNAGNSMVSNANIIKKIYFPRLIIPVSSVLVGLFDFCMAFVVFIVYCIVRGDGFVASAAWRIPLAVLLTCIATTGTGCLLAALNVKYRDFRYVIPFLIQLLFFLTPVIYPVKISASPALQWVMALNPMTAPVELFRSSLGVGMADTASIAMSVSSGLILLLLGLFYFRRTEAYFADLA
jgi:lipopolysaccharide transport system permease protein